MALLSSSSRWLSTSLAHKKRGPPNSSTQDHIIQDKKITSFQPARLNVCAGCFAPDTDRACICGKLAGRDRNGSKRAVMGMKKQ